MDLAPFLRAHSFMRVEQPPLMWEPDTQDEPFLRMLGEMIVVGLRRGNELEALTLNVSNVIVEPDEEDASIPDGEYVAITVRGAGAWEDDVWRSGQGPTKGLLSHVGPAAGNAGAVYAYARSLGADGGSVTTLLPRFVPPS